MDVKSGRKEKVRVVQELNEKFNKAKSIILTDFKGLNVKDLTDIRNRLRRCGAEYKVIKNTLARRAAEGTGLQQVEGYFSGTTGVVLSYSDIVAPVKTLLEYLNKVEAFKIKVGVLEGSVVEPSRIKEIANLPPREVLLVKALGSIKTPLYGLATTLQGLTRKLVFVLSAVKEARAR